MTAHSPSAGKAAWRQALYRIIYQSNTPAGKWFDIVLIISILLSVGSVMLSSVIELNARYGQYFNRAEWCFTLLFTVEYMLRIVCTGRPIRYLFSFYGIVDLLSILPTYLSLLFTGTSYFLVVRILRILRIFRILKLAPYISQGNLLTRALLASRQKITIFLFVVSTIIVIFGSAMFLIEGPENGFSSIPRSVYWAIVTLTTVGYGDISPKTELGAGTGRRGDASGRPPVMCLPHTDHGAGGCFGYCDVATLANLDGYVAGNFGKNGTTHFKNLGISAELDAGPASNEPHHYVCVNLHSMLSMTIMQARKPKMAFQWRF